MLCWEEELCDRLARQGRYVIRFDNRDTGRSTYYPPGQPGYNLSDMAQDAIAILDALGIERAHIVGRSMAGAIALVLAVDHSDRVASVTLVTTTTGDDDLPPMSPAFLEAASGTPDFSDPDAIVDYIVDLVRAYSGPSPYFDETGMRATAVEDVARTTSMASALTNHFLIDFDGPRHGSFSDITAPTLVIHGEKDPVYPIEHGYALRDAVPGADLHVLRSAGHEVPRALWDEFCDALVSHTRREAASRNA
jgi:pimeloyl-ACP methyl ester carboxylesterase